MKGMNSTHSDAVLPQPAQRNRQPAAGWRSVRWLDYAVALFAVTLLGGAYLLLHDRFPWFGYQAIGLIELFAVLLIAISLGRGPALLAAAVSALAWNYLFIMPRFTFAISSAGDVVLLVLYFVIALLAGTLAARLREREREARHNAERTLALYTLAVESATAANMTDILSTAVEQLGRVFAADVAILLAEGESLRTQPHPAGNLAVGGEDLAVARWAFDNGKHAGQFTDMHPQASALFVPLRTPARSVGVLGLRLHWITPPTFEQNVLIETFASQIALSIERELLNEAAQQSFRLRESERLYATLLNSISHELRTPLATIAGAAGSLIDAQANSNPAAQQELARDIQSAAGRLNRLVENLLDMSRLDAGRLQVRRDWCNVGEVIGVALQVMEDSLRGRALHVEIAPDLPLIEMDFRLIEQALVNLLDNACSHTPAGTPVEISARMDDSQLVLTVADRGPGIPAGELARVFDKFYRLPGTAAGGTGLGLSICHGLVEAHGGTVSAANRAGGGLAVTILLPAGALPPPVKEAAL